MKAITYVVTILWLIVGLYFGIGGWQGSKDLQKTSVQRTNAGASSSYDYDGINFKDEEALRQFLRERTSNRWFPWIFSIPADVPPLIAAIAFGLVGGTGRLLKKISLDSEEIAPSKLLSEPLFSAVIGMAIFFLSLLLPALFTSGRNPVRPEAIVGLSLFGGIFSEHAFNWMEKQVKRAFFSAEKRKPKRKEAPNA